MQDGQIITKASTLSTEENFRLALYYLAGKFNYIAAMQHLKMAWQDRPFDSNIQDIGQKIVKLKSKYSNKTPEFLACAIYVNQLRQDSADGIYVNNAFVNEQVNKKYLFANATECSQKSTSNRRECKTNTAKDSVI